MTRATRERLDRLLVDLGHVPTRARAQALILAGSVDIDGQLIRQSSALVATDARIAIRSRPPFVSRGGLKLDHALTAFGRDPGGLTVADVGASTGGFTDCLLQRGAAHVVAIDVGHGQLDYRLRTDSRVTVLERTNIRYLVAPPRPVDAAVVDVSFISLRLVLPVLSSWLGDDGAWIICLVKPQFEAGRADVARGGVVRDPRVHAGVVEAVKASARDLGWRIRGLTPSPILGPAGNREFLLHLARSGDDSDPGVPTDAA